MRSINFFAINPKTTPRPFPVPIKLEEARVLNDRGQDIYWTFNEFSGFGKRTKKDLKKIWAVYCEVDGVSKESILKILVNRLAPSLIVESRNGLHLYWYLKEPIDCTENPEKWADWYHSFVKARFLHVFNADPQACDACRLLRGPFFKYWKRQKDGTFPDGSFYSDIIFDNEKTRYALKDIEKFFPEKKEVAAPAPPVAQRVESSASGDSLWKRANLLPVQESLERLSGTQHVGGEVFTFRKEKRATRIFVNGSPSNAWIDENGLIGSTAGAGPAIPNWLHFYNKDWGKVAQILKQVFFEEGK